MIWLAFTLLATTAFGAGLKLSEAANRDRVVVAFINYVVGAAAALGYGLSPFAKHPFHLSGPTLAAGAFAGVAWTAGLITMMLGVRAAGLALSTGISRLSVIVPVLACVILWDEGITATEGAGIAIAVGAVILLGSRAARGGGGLTGTGAMLLVMLFTCQAMAQTAMKLFERYCPSTELIPFLVTLFTVAALLTGIWTLGSRRPFRRGDMVFGAILGVPNLLTGAFQTLALLELDGKVVYPVTNVGSVVILALAGVILWKERLGPRGLIGILLTLVGLLLLHSGQGGG